MDIEILKNDGYNINILGTVYNIKLLNYEDEPDFKNRDAVGLCNMSLKRISLCDEKTRPGYIDVSNDHALRIYNEFLRHEIIHAFLYESGLDNETHDSDCGWAVDEEIIDWFAIQSPKIFKVFSELEIM